MNPNRVVKNGPKTTVIEYSLFTSILAVIAIVTLDATGHTLNGLFATILTALQAAG